MIRLLDSNAVIRLIARRQSFLLRVHGRSPGDFAISSIVVHEIAFGAYRSQRVADNLAELDALRFPILAFDADDAKAAGAIRARLRAEGRPIGPYDTLIAGQALARGMILVTHNTAEFARVEGLQLEDWEA